MKYNKEWQDYLDSLNDCCQATYKTVLYTKACVLYVNECVKDVEEVVKGLNKVELELGKVRDYYGQYDKEASLAILVR